MLKNLIRILFLTIIIFPNCHGDKKENQQSKPNIIWIVAEDMNDWMPGYGDSTIITPNLDLLARKGIRFNRAYMTAGVCSASRSAIALGTIQTTLGVHNHRSSRQRTPEEKIHLPDSIKTIYQIMRDNDYYVVNLGPKNDFNFLWPGRSSSELKKRKSKYGHSVYQSEHEEDLLYDINSHKWAFQQDIIETLPKDKALFLQIQLKGGKNTGIFKEANKNESHIRLNKKKVFTDTALVKVMPYYPEIPSVKLEIAHHYDCIRQTDDEIGEILSGLQKADLLENAVIFFWSDHGMKLPRHKQWLYEGGIRVPMIIAGNIPKTIKQRNDLISGIDITATTLRIAGITIPSWMEGQNLFAADYKREYVISARDRCDYSIDRVRSVTSLHYKYIKNFLTDRPFSQPQYRDKFQFMKDMKVYFNEGKMDEYQSFLWQEKRPEEEFYNLEKDPHEMNNLIGDEEFLREINKHRQILSDWIKATDDKGQYPENEQQLKAVLTQWSEEAVNPEYKKITHGEK